MKQLKIVEPGWETYTGQLGMIEFVDGLSVGEFSLREARRIAGSLQVVDAETGVSPSIAQAMVDNVSEEAAVPANPYGDEGQGVGGEEPPADPVYTSEKLAEIADKGGIKALREIGDKMGVKDNSIAGLIEAILEAQTPKG